MKHQDIQHYPLGIGARNKRKNMAQSEYDVVGLQIYKMINLGSNVIVYKLKHCVLHFEVNMMTF